MTVAGNFGGSGDKVSGPCVSSVMIPGNASTHVPRYLWTLQLRYDSRIHISVASAEVIVLL